MERFLGRVGRARPLERLHSSIGWGFEIPDQEISSARGLVAGEFDRDTREVVEIVNRTPLLDRTLFDPSVLFRSANGH